MIDLPPCVVDDEGPAGWRGELVVGVGFPGDGAVELANVLVLDVRARREVNSNCDGSSDAEKSKRIDRNILLQIG